MEKQKMINKKDLTPYQLDAMNGKICPYCKSATKTITQQEVYGRTFSKEMIIACMNFPHCDSYVGTHSDGTPLGRLANKRLRLLKKDCKEPFNRLWEIKRMVRSYAYEKLAEYLDLDPQLTHFGMFGEETCIKARDWALSKLIEFDKQDYEAQNLI